MVNPVNPYAPGLTIPNTPPASTVNPTDLVWIWQNGQLLEATVSLFLAGLPAIGNSGLASMAAQTIKSNIGAASAAPADNSLSAIFDAILGSGVGSLIVRGASGWTALSTATAGQVLVSQSGAPPAFQTQLALANFPNIGASTLLANVAGSPNIPAAVALGGVGGILDLLLGTTAGALLIRDPSLGWTILAPGTIGQVLASNGAGANPSYQSVSGTGTVTSVQVSGGTTGLTFSGGPVTGAGSMTMAGTLALASGGTGASTIPGAQAALGFGFLVNQAVTANAASLSINYASGGDVSLSLAANVTSFSITNWPASGQFGRIVIEIANTGSFNITGWPGTTVWAGGSAPTITSGNGKKDTICLTSNDGGNNFRGYVLAQNMS